MRAAVKLLFWSGATLLITLIPLRIFFSDVKPIAWSEVTQTGFRLQLAFFLLTVENIAIFGVAVTLLAMFALWARRYRAASSK